MKRLIDLFAFLCACSLAVGCIVTPSSHYNRTYRVEPDAFRLAESKDDEGRGKTWTLVAGVGHEPRLERTENYTETLPRIGVNVGAVTRERAEKAGVEPWQGVWVEQVSQGLPAEQAGLAKGDIILAIGKTRITSVEQFLDVLQQNLAVDQEIDFLLRIYRRPGEPLGSQAEARVSLKPVGIEVNRQKSDSFALQTSKGILSFSGMQLAEIPPLLGKEVFGEEKAKLYVCAVSTGSPAYHAGLRPGDVILTCDGEPVEGLGDLRKAVQRRIGKEDYEGPLYDLVAYELPASTSSLEGNVKPQVALDVRGPLGFHSTELSLRPDAESSSTVSVPVLLDYESELDEKRVKFLDFIFNFGFDYRSKLHPSEDRQVKKTSNLSLLPLGLFKVSRSLSSTSYTLLWFIRFKSS